MIAIAKQIRDLQQKVLEIRLSGLENKTLASDIYIALVKTDEHLFRASIALEDAYNLNEGYYDD